MRDNEGTQLDQQVHDAYEGIRLSDDAQDRMLGQLLAAQTQRGAQEVDGDASPVSEEAPGPDSRVAASRRTTPPTHAGRRRLAWRVVLPLAAMLVVGVVVVRTQGMFSEAARETSNSAAAPLAVQKDAASNDALATGAEDTGAEETEGVAYDAGDLALEDLSVAAPEAEAVVEDAYEEERVQPEWYPQVTMADGTTLTTCPEGGAAQQVDEAQVGDALGEATAAASDGSGETVDCMVFALADDAHAYAVRYAGDERYWYGAAL